MNQWTVISVLYKSIIDIQQYCRVKAFEEILQQDVIDLKKLQELAFNGKYKTLYFFYNLHYPYIVPYLHKT